jgi:hypothetical protein
MRPRVRIPVLPCGFFLEGEDPHGDHGLGSLVELRFKAPPGTSYPYITIHLIITAPHGRPNLRSRLHFGHNQEGDHEVHKGHVVVLAKKMITVYITTASLRNIHTVILIKGSFDPFYRPRRPLGRLNL